MIQIEHQTMMSFNWVKESTTPQRRNNFYFKNLCGDSIKGLRAGETVYCFNSEQVSAIRANAPFEVVVIEVEGCFKLNRALRNV